MTGALIIVGCLWLLCAALVALMFAAAADAEDLDYPDEHPRPAPRADANQLCARIITCNMPGCGCRRECLCVLPAGHAPGCRSYEEAVS